MSKIEKTENELALENVMAKINPRYAKIFEENPESRVDVFYGAAHCLDCVVRYGTSSCGGLHFDLKDNGVPIQCRDDNKVVEFESHSELLLTHGLAERVYWDQQKRISEAVRQRMGGNYK